MEVQSQRYAGLVFHAFDEGHRGVHVRLIFNRYVVAADS